MCHGCFSGVRRRFVENTPKASRQGCRKPMSSTDLCLKMGELLCSTAQKYEPVVTIDLGYGNRKQKRKKDEGFCADF